MDYTFYITHFIFISVLLLSSHNKSTGTGRTEAGDTGQWGRWERSCNHFPRPPPVPHARLIVRLATQERRRTPRKRL